MKVSTLRHEIDTCLFSGERRFSDSICYKKRGCITMWFHPLSIRTAIGAQFQIFNAPKAIFYFDAASVAGKCE
jgi:hypothetical protein